VPAESGSRFVTQRKGLLVAALVTVLALVGAVSAIAFVGRGEEAPQVAALSTPSGDPTTSGAPTPSTTTSPSNDPTASPSPSPSQTASASPQAEGPPPVRAPLNLRPVSVSTTSVTLAWAAAPNGGTAIRFLIYRNNQQIGQTRQSTFTDEDLSPSTTYGYRVFAVGRDESRARSEAIEVTTQAVGSAGGNGNPDGGAGGAPDTCTFEEWLAGECDP
jgi:hypothetical protein